MLAGMGCSSIDCDHDVCIAWGLHLRQYDCRPSTLWRSIWKAEASFVTPHLRHALDAGPAASSPCLGHDEVS